MCILLTKIEIDFDLGKECIPCGKILTNCNGKLCNTGMIMAGLLPYGKTELFVPCSRTIL